MTLIICGIGVASVALVIRYMPAKDAAKSHSSITYIGEKADETHLS